MIVVVEILLGDDSVECPVSIQILCNDGEMILELLSNRDGREYILVSFLRNPYRSTVCLDAKQRLDSRLQRCLLELEVRADVTMLGQGHARVPQLSRAGDMLSRGTEPITEAECTVVMEVDEPH
jgi:hypothetical protein